MSKSIFRKDNAFETAVLEPAANEVLCSRRKTPSTNRLWCEKEWGSKCREVLAACIKILDEVGPDAVKLCRIQLIIYLSRLIQIQSLLELSDLDCGGLAHTPT